MKNLHIDIVPYFKHIKRVFTSMKAPKRKKARLPRKLKKRLQRSYYSNPVNIQALKRTLLPRMPQAYGSVIDIHLIDYKAAEKRVLSAIGIPPNLGGIKVEGVDALYTIPTKTTNP